MLLRTQPNIMVRTCMSCPPHGPQYQRSCSEDNTYFGNDSKPRTSFRNNSDIHSERYSCVFSAIHWWDEFDKGQYNVMKVVGSGGLDWEYPHANHSPIRTRYAQHSKAKAIAKTHHTASTYRMRENNPLLSLNANRLFFLLSLPWAFCPPAYAIV